MRYVTKKAGQKFEQAFGANPPASQQTQKEGSVSIDKTPDPDMKSKNSVGEYVDFEEVE